MMQLVNSRLVGYPKVGRFNRFPKSRYQPGAGRAVYVVGRDGSSLAYVNFPFLRCPPTA